jgi:heme exporter protein CcmD
MIELGPYAHYIIWAYLGVALLVIMLIGVIVHAARRVRARLRSLEERGVTRRSAGRTF